MSKLLFTPGPTNVPEAIREVLGQDLIHHRMADYHELMKEVNADLKKVFDTKNDVLILTSSGTGSMESTVVNLFSTGDEVLVINTGWFGERFIDLCQVYGLKPHILNCNWGESYNLDDVKNMLEQYPAIKGIFVTYHETATGVVNNLEALGNLTKNTDRLLIADCISGMVVQEFHLDAWGVDCAVASSQKGFYLPPGLSFVALSDKAIKACEQSNIPKYYWDYRKYMNYFTTKSEQPYTPAISIVVALKTALTYLLTKGLPTVIAEKEAVRKYAEAKFEALGFELFIKNEAVRGNVLVPVLPPKDIDVNKLTAILDAKFDLTVAGGMSQYAGKMLRVGIIGEITTTEVDMLLDRIVEVLPECTK
ncbi:MAG TPA: aminotransferase [Firmicutes bacterium]|nr:aminotransferase [Bacillota bacterium]